MRTTEAHGGSSGPWSTAFEVFGRVFSILVLAWGIFTGHSSSLVFLWGLWIEEVFTLIGLLARKGLARKAFARTALARVSGSDAAPLALYFVFPAAHLVFVLFFTLIGTTGMFSAPDTPRMVAPAMGSLVRVAAAFLLWTVLDVVRAAIRLRTGGIREQELAAIDKRARLALFLPHITIIAGGFCLIMFRLANWLAWGILGGKVLFEMLSFGISREKQRPPG